MIEQATSGWGAWSSPIEFRLRRVVGALVPVSVDVHQTCPGTHPADQRDQQVSQLPKCHDTPHGSLSSFSAVSNTSEKKSRRGDIRM
jgi:hypothetical protein